jgi:branched-chain amino acid transport system permease protein
MSMRRVAFAAIGFGFFLLAPHVLRDFQLFQLCLIAGTAVIVLGLVVVTGMAGQISLAQSAFVAVGSYGSAILADKCHIPLWAGIPVSAVGAAFVGFALGQITLRVAGHYLALATLAFTAIVQLILIHADDLTGGAAGMPVPAFAIGSLVFSKAGQLYYVIVPAAATAFLIFANLLRSRFGRMLAAMRQSEIATASVGINVLRCKALAFAASAFLGALGGGLLAPLTSYLDPAQFGVIEAISLLAMAVIGGMRSPIGAVLGSAIFILLPEALQHFQTYLGLIFALLLCVSIVARPDGLASLRLNLGRGR